jgi:hypothetical protein
MPRSHHLHTFPPGFRPQCSDEGHLRQELDVACSAVTTTGSCVHELFSSWPWLPPSVFIVQSLWQPGSFCACLEFSLIGPGYSVSDMLVATERVLRLRSALSVAGRAGSHCIVGQILAASPPLRIMAHCRRG